ncbi:MAG: SDR family oxidoreductase [Rhizobiaceae bacterium]|nr:SDR family oxidoreductase [Rhizobiaceae bacterium]
MSAPLAQTNGKPSKPLEGRRVAVTGAASGIGREIARTFTAAGAHVAALDINLQALDGLKDELGCATARCDVTDPDSVASAFDAVVAGLGGLDILVSNAGSADQGPIGDLPMDVLRRSFELNFFGHQHACQAAIRVFRSQGGGGALLFNISNQSVNPGKDFGPYGIPKAATMALMKQYALDHGKEGIRANGINAGRIRTGLLTEQMIAERAVARGLSPKEYLSGNLLGVEVTASDIADAFLHLALMDKVNAAVITVDGGNMATSLR